MLWLGKTGFCEIKGSPNDLSVAADVSETSQKLPYVYREWKHFTVKEGLPNDHVFAIKAEGPKVWVGTENGLACIDKQTGKIKSWKEEDGLPCALSPPSTPIPKPESFG